MPLCRPPRFDEDSDGKLNVTCIGGMGTLNLGS